jgi:hypothetical protein
MSTERTRIITTIAAAFVCSVAGAPVHAAPSDAHRETAGTAATSSQARPERRICIKNTVTGTRVAPRVCRTESEWIRTEGEVPTKQR